MLVAAERLSCALEKIGTIRTIAVFACIASLVVVVILRVMLIFWDLWRISSLLTLRTECIVAGVFPLGWNSIVGDVKVINLLFFAKNRSTFFEIYVAKIVISWPPF